MPFKEESLKVLDEFNFDKKIQDQVSEHYEDFLNHSSGITTLENVIVMMQSHIQVK